MDNCLKKNGIEKKTIRTNPVMAAGRFRADMSTYLRNKGFDVFKKMFQSLIIFTRQKFNFDKYTRKHSSTNFMKFQDLNEYLSNLKEGTMDVGIFEEIRSLPTWDKIYLNDGTYIYGKLAMSSIKFFCESTVLLPVKDIQYIYFHDQDEKFTLKTRKNAFYSGVININTLEIDMSQKVNRDSIKLIVLDEFLHSFNILYDIYGE